MSDYVEKLQADLRTRLECLSHWVFFPGGPVDEYFTELRKQVDLNAEKAIIEINREKSNVDDKSLAMLNATREDFICIIETLEKKIALRLEELQKRPRPTSNKAYESIECKVVAFKNSSSSLDDLEDMYVQLAREIIDEIYREKKHIFGEQSIIYWPSNDKDRLGSLVYFGDLFLSQEEIDSLIPRHLVKAIHQCDSIQKSSASPLLVRAYKPIPLSKNSLAIKNLSIDDRDNFAKASEFCYVGKSDAEYSHGLKVKKRFVNYQFKDDYEELTVANFVSPDASENLFDVYSSKICKLSIWDIRLRGLPASLIPTPVERLVALNLSRVYVESWDTDLLSEFVNIKDLRIQATFSKDVKLDLAFLKALTKLETLELSLPDSPSDLSVLKELTELKNMKLEGASFFYAEKPPKLTKAALEQILSVPHLQSLKLYYLDIEPTGLEMFIGSTNIPRDENIVMNRFTHLYMVDVGIRVLRMASFAGMTHLLELSLKGNSIADLPCGVFDDLINLGSLDLSQNCIRGLKRGLFPRASKLSKLNLDGNPIEAIDAKAFFHLQLLENLSLNGCRLKSIDSMVFDRLFQLRELNLNNNLIERIEVVAEYGRRINVAKASLNDEEREIVKNNLFNESYTIGRLKLSGNRLEKLDLNCFSNLACLMTLDLSSNKLSELSGEAAKELLPNLGQLFLQDNHLTTIGKSALPKCLFHLNLSKNKLESLNDDFFVGLTRLAMIDLSHNKLTWTITDSTLDSCRHRLAKINLLHNVSIRLTERAFRQTPNLHTIFGDLIYPIDNSAFLEGMRLSRSRPEIQEALEKLYSNQQQSSSQAQSSTKDLANCESHIQMEDADRERDIVQFEKARLLVKCFGNLPSLNELDFSRNEIKSLDNPYMFSRLVISTIDLSNNQVSRIHRDFFMKLSLRKIDLSSNNLSSIDMGVFRHLPYLRELDLSSNRISFLNLTRLFWICPLLESLNVAYNQLDDRSTTEPINRSTTESVDGWSSNNLQKLVIAKNRLEKMDFVRDMTRLEHLDLGGNQIVSVMANGENLLGRLSKLIHLDLSVNRIDSLTHEMLTHLRGQLEHLDLSGNPAEIHFDKS